MVTTQPQGRQRTPTTKDGLQRPTESSRVAGGRFTETPGVGRRTVTGPRRPCPSPPSVLTFLSCLSHFRPEDWGLEIRSQLVLKIQDRSDQ